MQGKLLRVHIGEHDRWQGKPLYEAVVDKCREMGIAGATVFRGLEGYGDLAEVHRRPILVIIADTAENIDRLAPALEAMLETGLMAISEVEMIRVEKPR